MSSNNNTVGVVGGRRLAAISFLDIVGYSVLMAEDAERTHLSWMRILGEIIRPSAQQHRGKVVKSTGDGVLAEFLSALDAVEWARDVQRMLRNERQSEDGKASPIVVRIAVHVDDIFPTEDDIFGPGVNITARLQEHAEPGGIVVSEAVHHLVGSSIGVSLRDLGLLNLKNIEQPIRAYALEMDTPAHPGPVRFRPTTLPSIAVLPLRNLSGDPADDYFAEGIVEDITVSLASLLELLVIARGSTVALGRRQSDPREVGHALGVRYVLSGSVRRSATLLRVSVRLHDVQSGVSLWGDTSEVTPGELFAVQDQIVQRIVAGIAPHVRLAELRNALRKRPESFTAYDLTLQALNRISSLEKPIFLQAKDYLKRAMAENHDFAMPIAWAARWYSLLIGQGWSATPREDAAKASALASRAIELDRQNALALATYGHVKSFLFHDYDTALDYFDRALAACPNSALAWILSSGTLSYVGRGEQAVHHAQRAVRLSPFDQSLFQYYMFLGMAHYTNGDYEEAVRWGRLSFSENPLYTANLRILTASLAALDRLEEARATAAKLVSLEPEFSVAKYESTLLPFRDAEIRARCIGHLVKTGLPP